MKLVYMYIILLSLVTGLEPLDPVFPEYFYEYNDTHSGITPNTILFDYLNSTLDFILEHTPQEFIIHSRDYTIFGKIKIVIIELVVIIVWFAIIRTVVKYCWSKIRHQHGIEQPEDPNVLPQPNNELPDEAMHGQHDLISEPSTSSTSPEISYNKFLLIKTRQEYTLPEEPQRNLGLPIELHELHGKYTSKSELGSSQEILQHEDKPTSNELLFELRGEHTSLNEPGPPQEITPTPGTSGIREDEKEDKSE